MAFKTPVIVSGSSVTGTMASVEDLGTHAIGLETISGQEHEDQQPCKWKRNRLTSQKQWIQQKEILRYSIGRK